MKNKNKIQGSLIMLIVALIWGTTFIAQSLGMNYVSPLFFNAIRSLFAVITLGIYILIKRKSFATKITKECLLCGAICGVALCFATNLQQIGLVNSTVGKAGFITSFYIIFVPVIGVFLNKKLKINVWISVLISLVGFYFLCVDENMTLSSDVIILTISSLFFAIQIVLVEKFVKKENSIYLTFIQFLVVFIITIIPSIIIEKPSAIDIWNGKYALLYAGVLSSGIAYTLQMMGQEKIEATVSSLIMSLESVIAFIFGVILLNEKIIGKEVLGCILIFTAVILSQIEIKTSKKTIVNP